MREVRPSWLALLECLSPSTESASISKYLDLVRGCKNRIYAWVGLGKGVESLGGFEGCGIGGGTEE
jgi:hypothetical protein